MKAVKMKDIAEAMNVSVVTVSKALSGKSGVGEQLRQKIISKAQELGYLYSSQLQSSNFQGNIGIVVADRFFNNNSFYSNMYRNLLLECSASGVSSLLEIVTLENEKKCVLPNFLIAQKCDGVIFMGEMSNEYVKAVSKTGIPYVLLDFYYEQNVGKDNSIISAGLSGSYQLTCHLIERGYRDIGFVGRASATSSIMDRYLGYYKALISHDIPLNPQWIIPDRDEDGIFMDFTLPEVLPQAFVCNCDETAYLLQIKLKNLGIKIPQDVALVGFDDFRFALLSDPPLTTYRVNVERMARLAIKNILDRINNPTGDGGSTVVSGNLVERESVGRIN